MIRIWTQLVLAAALLAGSLAPPALAQQMPPVSATDLNKKPVSWPKDFKADHTVLMIAFDRSQQGIVDSWVKGLGLSAPNAAPWFEVPLINNPGKLIRSFIDSGMRRGIPSPEARAHVVTLYVKKKDFMQTMQLPDEDVHILVMDRTGTVVARAKGLYTASAAAPLAAVLSSQKSGKPS